MPTTGPRDRATERRAETLRVSLVTGDYFRVLGINPGLDAD
jgi:hypothetical protein